MKIENGYIIIGFSFALYILAVIFFYPTYGDVAGVSGVVPIVLASWLYGRLGGVLVALSVAVSAIYFLLFTNIIPDSQVLMLTARSFAGIAIGYIIGFSQEEASRLRKMEVETLTLKLGIEKSKDIVFITDGEGIINYINPAFTKAYGYSFDEVKGKTPSILKSGYRDAKFYKDFWQKIKSGQSMQIDMKNMTKDGRMLEIESSINPVMKKDGEIIGFLAMQRDITEKKKVEADLIKRTRELEKLNSIMVGRELRMKELKDKMKLKDN